MFEDIKKNKIKSWFIVLLFLAFIAVIVYYICMALDLGELSIIIAMIFAIVSMIIATPSGGIFPTHSN